MKSCEICKHFHICYVLKQSEDLLHTLQQILEDVAGEDEVVEDSFFKMIASCCGEYHPPCKSCTDEVEFTSLTQIEDDSESELSDESNKI